MKLADLSTGPDWVVYVGFIIFAVLSIVLISGHGSWLISGYNTASKEEKAKYNEKKLCRTMGIGMSVIAILLLIMGGFENDMYPESWTHIYMNQAEHMDAILYCTGGIHFVFAETVINSV